MTSAAPSVWIAGATGLVGRALVPLLQDGATHASESAPAPLHALVRTPAPALQAAGVHQHVVNLAQLDASALPPPLAAYCALGTTIKVAGSQAAFRAVDFEAVLAFAQAARQAGAPCFAVISALGADAHSRVFYNRVKGDMEAAVAALGFASVVIARPSLLVGDRGALGQPLRVGERLGQWISAPLRPLLPPALRPIAAACVARALVRAVAQARAGVWRIESADLHTLGRA